MTKSETTIELNIRAKKAPSPPKVSSQVEPIEEVEEHWRSGGKVAFTYSGKAWHVWDGIYLPPGKPQTSPFQQPDPKYLSHTLASYGGTFQWRKA